MAQGLRILVACEFSGVVRRAFAARGHDVWSCDLLPATDGSNRHVVGDARSLLHEKWDMLMVAHPPCTRLCNSGFRWLHEPPPGRTREDVWQELQDAAALFSDFWNAPIARIAIENPVMHRHAKALIRGFREASQSVQPWQFGHPETKRTCFWLKGLSKLRPTNVVEGRIQRVARLPPSPDRWKLRSETYPGIAEAMADQWGGEALRVAA